MKKNPERWTLPIEEKHFDSALQVVDGLYNIERTGWIQRSVENPETVGEHTDALIALAEEIADLIPKLDKKKLLRMLQIHDWPELITGDIVTAGIAPEKYKEAAKNKFDVEFAAMEKLCSRLGKEGETNMELWLEYEKGETLEANIAVQLDKLQAMLKAREYEKAGNGKVSAQEFINHARHKITHPILLAMLVKIDNK